MKKLQDKVAVVTGGNSGIGYATAKALKAEGARVMISGRSAEKVNSAAEALGVEGLVADVSEVAQIEDLVEGVRERYDREDLLFVNAGVMALEPVGHISEQQFDSQLGINFKGAVFTIEKFLPMLKEGASVVVLSSIAAHTGTPNIAAYSASKAAINAYARTAAIELAPRNIRVNVVSPGPTETSIFGKLGLADEQITFVKENNRSIIPLKRMGQPEEIAQMVIFLASGDAAFITGAEFTIDGGMLIKT